MKCSHTFGVDNDSVLELCTIPGDKIACGTERGRLIIWNMNTYTKEVDINCHDSHILSMMYYNGILYTAGGDGKIMGWNVEDFTCQIVIHAAFDSGEILALVNHAGMLYLSCKNGSIQWFDIANTQKYAKKEMFDHWEQQDNRFFNTQSSLHDLQEQNPHADMFVVMKDMTIGLAHHGAVNSMLLHDNQLYSCSGDGVVKIWSLEAHKPKEIRSLKLTKGAVFKLHIQDGYLYAGLQQGEISCYDLESLQCIRTLVGHVDDVLTLCGVNGTLISGGADGTVKTWNRNFECLQTVQAHEGFVLCLAVSGQMLTSGGNGYMKVWDLPTSEPQDEQKPLQFQDQMMAALETFVSQKSISGHEHYVQECVNAGNYVKTLLKELGAQTRLVQGKDGRNNIVLAKFLSGKQGKSVLYYGHYDTQPVVRSKWHTDPFRMTGKDGYVYGRGVSDNKGPTLAVIFAVSEMQKEKTLSQDVYFIIEGEEESGSHGLYESIEEQSDFLPPQIDVVLISNSYWYDEVTPCLTYGLRGVIHAEVQITGHTSTDVHSGVHGGSLDEPMDDMVKVLSQIYSKPSRQVTIEGFMDNVSPLSDFERRSYERLARYELGDGATESQVEVKVSMLQSKWRTPSFTIHNIQVSGNSTNTVIPHTVTAKVSFRIVPNQSLAIIVDSFKKHVEKKFAALKSRNHLDVRIGHTANWWLGEFGSKYYQAAEKALIKEWNTPPLYIREGGSLPAVPWLQNHFQASVVHIPMGQASDNAHLPNERIRIQNLAAGRRVIQYFLEQLQ